MSENRARLTFGLCRLRLWCVENTRRHFGAPGHHAPSPDSLSSLTPTHPSLRTFLNVLRSRAQLARYLTIATLFILTIAVRWNPPNEDLPKLNEALSAARGLAKTGTLSDPFVPAPTGPTAHVAPAFPALAAAVISVLQNGPRAHFALWLIATVVTAVLVALLPITASYYRLGFLSGVLASLLHIVAKVPAFHTWEATYVALVTIVLTLLLHWSFTSQPSVRLIVLTGTVWGIGILFNPILIPPCLLWVFYQLYRAYRQQLPRSFALLSVAVPAVLCVPWIVRNYFTFNRFVLIRDNLGLELQVSNNECAHFNLRGNFRSGCFDAHHPNVNHSQASQIQAIGEVRYNEQKLREARAWILSHPHRFLELSIQRFVHFWFPTDELRLTNVLKDVEGYRQYALVVWTATLLSLLGLLLGWRDGHRSSLLLSLLWFLFYSPIYYFAQYEHRYRIPILWVTFLWAGYALATLMTSLTSSFAAKIGLLPDQYRIINKEHGQSATR